MLLGGGWETCSNVEKGGGGGGGGGNERLVPTWRGKVGWGGVEGLSNWFQKLERVFG